MLFFVQADDPQLPWELVSDCPFGRADAGARARLTPAPTLAALAFGARGTNELRRVAGRAGA
jgi:hypothetical protein